MEIASSKWHQVIHDAAGQIGIHPTDSQLRHFDRYVEELLKWNRRINLTRIVDPMEIAVKHIVDSLIPESRIPNRAKVMDMGAGAGFPGIPLKIIRPDLQLVLVDAVRKKVGFMQHVIRLLELENTTAIQMRLENVSEVPELVGTFDVVISRALSRLPNVINWALPYVRPGGNILALKGSNVQKEWEEAVKSLKTHKPPWADSCPPQRSMKISTVAAAQPLCRRLPYKPGRLSTRVYKLPILGDQRTLVEIDPTDFINSINDPTNTLPE